MEQQLKNFLKAIKLNESTVSMILGLIVVLVVGGLLINYFRLKPAQLPTITDSDVTTQTGDVADQEQYADTPADQLPPYEGELPTKYKVRAGDTLWKVAERFYKTGYAWQEIAQANSLALADDISAGQELTIPQLAKAYPQTLAEANPAIGGESTDSADPTPEPTVEATATPEPTPTPEPTATPTPEPEPTSTVEPTQAAEPTSTPEPEPTPTTDEEPETAVQPDQPEQITGDSYTVVQGDNLWNIAVRAYGDGYKWTEIAQANNLVNPSVIHAGNQFTLPR